MRRDPSRVALEKKEWRKHAEKTLTHSNVGEEKQNVQNPNWKTLYDDKYV